MPQSGDLYEVLHVHPSAHPDVIQAAYRRLALLYHPDTNPSPEANDLMAAINRAYEVLSDPEGRVAYDRDRDIQVSDTVPGGSSVTDSPQPSHDSSGASRKPSGYFTLGSTKSEVEQVQGPPHDATVDYLTGQEKWHYEEDSIEFGRATGRVQAWANLSDALRVQLFPGAHVTAQEYFTIGSHQDDVIRLQGTPFAIFVIQSTDVETWFYRGRCKVEFSFSTKRVTDWESPDWNLKARRETGNRPNTPGGHAFLGLHSGKQDVLRLQGPPTSTTKTSLVEIWRYGRSWISFAISTGAVINWSDADNNLRVGAAQSTGDNGTSANTFRSPERPEGSGSGNFTAYFTIGSTKADVVNIHGTTRDINFDDTRAIEIWKYEDGNSVDFALSSGEVQGWDNVTGDLKARLVPGTDGTTSAFFTVGSHQDDVMRLQGNPRRVLFAPHGNKRKSVWYFHGGDGVEVFGEFVSAWENYLGTLNAQGIDGGDWTHAGQLGRPSPYNSPTSSSEGRPRDFTSNRKSDNWVTTRSGDNVAIRTTDPIDNDYSLTVRFWNRELEVYVDWGAEISLSETTMVNYQIDEGPTWRQGWHLSTDRTGTFMPAQDLAETIRALFEADEFTVRVYPFGGNPITAQFDVEGFAEAVDPVLEAWRRAGTPAPRVGSQRGGCFLLPVGALFSIWVAAYLFWYFL